MEATGSYKAIIEKLAFEAPITIYRLNKEIGYSTSTIHASIHKLMKEKFVKRIKEGYVFTFIGLMRYFMQRFSDEKFGREEVKRIVEKYASITDYALFTEHQWLEEMMGNEYYDLLLSSTFVTYRELTSRIHIISARAVTPIKRGEKVVLTGIELPSLEEVEAEWMRAYTLWFFNQAEKKLKVLNNPKLRALIKKTYGKELSLRKERITTLENMMQRLLGL